MKGFKKRSDKKFDQIYLLKDKQGGDDKMFSFNQKKNPEEEEKLIGSSLGENKEENKSIQIHSNQKTNLMFQFLYYPEYIKVGNRIVINMDNLSAIGEITEVYAHSIDGHYPDLTKKTAKIGCKKNSLQKVITKEGNLEMQPIIEDDIEEEDYQDLDPLPMVAALSRITEKSESIMSNDSNT